MTQGDVGERNSEQWAYVAPQRTLLSPRHHLGLTCVWRKRRDRGSLTANDGRAIWRSSGYKLPVGGLDGWMDQTGGKEEGLQQSMLHDVNMLSTQLTYRRPLLLRQQGHEPIGKRTNQKQWGRAKKEKRNQSIQLLLGVFGDRFEHQPPVCRRLVFLRKERERNGFNFLNHISAASVSICILWQRLQIKRSEFILKGIILKIKDGKA